MNSNNIPEGFNIERSLANGKGTITEVAWSQNGTRFATCSQDNSIRIWRAESGKLEKKLEGQTLEVLCITWSPDSRFLASGSMDKTVAIWDLSRGVLLSTLKGHVNSVVSLDWSPDGRILASGSEDGTIRLWPIQEILSDSSSKLKRARTLRVGPVRTLSWSPDGRMLAFGSDKKLSIIGDLETLIRKEVDETTHHFDLELHSDIITSLAWSIDGRTVASGSADATIRIVEALTGSPLRILEGNTKPISAIAYSSDGKLLASKSFQGTVLVWRSDSWEIVARLTEPTKYGRRTGLVFHPTRHILTTFNEDDVAIRLWNLDAKVLLRAPAVAAIQHTSAKVVLVGESNVGKSCLALRLVEDRYEEQGTTHGMRFWQLAPEQLSYLAAAPVGEKRELTLWDMGGQDEYRLIHQLFLHDTTVALLMFDPTRGRTAIEEVVGWNFRLEKQLGGRKAAKLLVGTKLDDTNAVVDRTAVENLVRECGFAGYYEISAKTGRGIPELRTAIARVLDWTTLAQTSRPVLFQRIRDVLERNRAGGVVTLLYADLVRQIQKEALERYDNEAVDAVVRQLAVQGILSETRLSSGERVLILQIDQIERYAGALIILARDNPRGLPALEERDIASSKLRFTGIKQQNRLPRRDELTVLESVVELLVEHNICLRHERLLIFPTLFRPSGAERGGLLNAVSLYYDFSGAVDNIYSSLVVALAYAGTFGRIRLWEDRAEFGRRGKGGCGLRKVERKSGLAHLDVYFEPETPKATRDLFLSFVDEHLRQQGVDLYERLEITCICGFIFDEETVRLRIAESRSDIACPRCERRTSITEGAEMARHRNPELENKTWALRTEVAKRTEVAVREVKRVFTITKTDRPAGQLILLHLSDLHFNNETDPKAMLQPLISDLRDRKGGLGFDRLDYLVISGDLGHRGKPDEFEYAREFISGLIERFDLTAARCIIVPGNHDLDWDEPIYDWQPRRLAESKKLHVGTYCEQGDGYLIRNASYPNRFKNFSENFYHPLVQQPYPLKFEEQGMAYLFADSKIQFLAFNSAWEIDEFFRERSSIEPSAIGRALTLAENQIENAVISGILQEQDKILRIAIWHHPIRGSEQMKEDAFLERLIKADTRICLHGHVHEDRAELVGYLHPTHQLHVIGAGSFGAPVLDRPESTPRLYNVLEIAEDRSKVRVHTRCLRKQQGAWEGWAVWPGAKASERYTYYEIYL